MAAPVPTVYQNGVIPVTGDQFNTFLQGVTTATQLRGFIGQPGMTVQLQGIAVPGDGGAGQFWWNATSTAPDDNFSVIVPNATESGAWNRLPTIQPAAFLPIAAGDIISNISTITAPPVGNPLSAIMDAAFGSTQGAIVVRNGGTIGWVELTPGTSGQVLQANGAAQNLSWATLPTVAIPTALVVSGNGTILSAASIAGNTVIGNAGTASGSPVALSETQLTALVQNFSTAASGAVPVSPGGTVDFLRADGTWVAVGGGTPTLTAGTVLGNTNTISQAGTSTTMSAMLDNNFGTVEGSVLYRGASGWAELSPGTAGQFLQTAGAGAVPVWASISRYPVVAFAQTPLQNSQISVVPLIAAGTFTTTGAIGEITNHPTATNTQILELVSSAGSIIASGTVTISTAGSITFPSITSAHAAGAYVQQINQSTADVTGGTYWFAYVDKNP